MTRRTASVVLLVLAVAFDAGAQAITRVLNDGATQREYHVADPGRIIIELSAPPLLARDGRRSAAADIDALLERLELDIDAMEGPRVMSEAAPVLRHRYSHVFSGASAQVKPQNIERIRRLDYVRAVHPDRVQKALLHDSVAQVGAPQVWQDYGTRGEGIVVAIIDTGIDYAHPALGGGFGPGFKVIGGRDFVNNDNDPMDDEGHGTHVAGIVAANGGGLLGVAPAASLLAYKVLDETGSGSDSAVMAAIEEAARQQAHVANMSLGRPAVANDPVITALENAAASGVLFAVAAGNGGKFLDIGSPGNAPSAVTVGAIDKEGRLAYFSSKGPVVPDGSMKPEVVAPGVDIVSSINGGGTRSASGTSMATPHVAGVAALLRGAHPEWPVAMVRSALINSARPMDDEVMAVGAGAVHALDAVRRNVQPSAVSLSFGISDQRQNPWITSKSMSITNRSPAAQSLAVTIEGARDGIEIIPSATSLSLEPGASGNISFELRLDHSKVEAPAFGSLSYGGLVRLSGDQSSIVVPWSFVKASRVRVAWTGDSSATVKLGTEHMMVMGTTANGTGTDLFIGAGPSTLWVEGRSQLAGATYHVFRENIDFATTPDVAVGPADAPHQIRFAGTDPSGRLLGDREEQSLREFLVSHPHFESNLFEAFLFVPPGEDLFLSTLPPETVLVGFERAFDEEPAVTWAAQYDPITSLSGDVDLVIPASRWRPLSARGIVPANVADSYQSIYATLWVKTPRGRISSFARPNVTQPAITGDTNIAAWMTSPIDDVSGMGVRIEMGTTPGGPLRPGADLVAEFTAVDDGIISGDDRPARLSSRVIGAADRITIGEGPAYPRVTTGTVMEMFFATVQWTGPQDEDRIYDATHTTARLLDSDGAVVTAVNGADLPVIFFGFQLASPLPRAGAYTFEASTTSFRVGGLPARGTIRSAFDTSRLDSTPPTLTSLRVIDGNGRTTPTIVNRPRATVRFSATDLGLGGLRRDRTSVQSRPHGASDDAWSPLTATVVGEDLPFGPIFSAIPDGVLYEVRLSEAAAADAIDLRIHVEDEEGNVTSYTVEPAFVVSPSRRRAVR